MHIYLHIFYIYIYFKPLEFSCDSRFLLWLYWLEWCLHTYEYENTKYMVVCLFLYRRKKKCIRYMESGDSNDGNQSDDNLGSCGSVGDAHTPPEDDTESLNHSLSSPGGLSGLSSLTSPSMILPSPSTSLASPSVSLASPCMSLQSPLTPHDSSAFDCKLPPNNVASAMPAGMPPHLQHNHQPHRNPVGTNPHDINNPLSVNQLTGQCVKSSPVVVSEAPANVTATTKDSTRPVISVT